MIHVVGHYSTLGEIKIFRICFVIPFKKKIDENRCKQTVASLP